MRLSLIVLTLFSLGGCSSFGGVLSSETTWFQDWSCQRQDGVCARTDTIDQITITELGGDPAEAGEERLTLVCGQLGAGSAQVFQSSVGVRSGQEPAAEHAHFAPCYEYDVVLGTAPQGFRPIRGFREESHHFAGVQLAREWREADLEARVGGMAGGKFQPFDVAARDAYDIAPEVARDDTHIERDLLRLEDRAGLPTARKYASIVMNSDPHGPCLITSKKVPRLPRIQSELRG